AAGTLLYSGEATAVLSRIFHASTRLQLGNGAEVRRVCLSVQSTNCGIQLWQDGAMLTVLQMGVVIVGEPAIEFVLAALNANYTVIAERAVAASSLASFQGTVAPLVRAPITGATRLRADVYKEN